MTYYKPGRSKTLSERGCMGFTFSPSNCFYWGAAAPQTPCSSWGASSPSDPLAGGLQPPVPPLGLSVDLGTKILVPRSWYQDLWGTGPRVMGTALSTTRNRYPFFTVRTPQAGLVGEFFFCRIQIDPPITQPNCIFCGMWGAQLSRLSAHFHRHNSQM